MKWVDYPEEYRVACRLLKEHNDCTVRAWANAFNAPYLTSHAWLKKHGRRHRTGMTAEEVSKAMRACGKTKIVFGPYTGDNRISVAAFCKKHPVGRYYVASRGHAFAIIDGIVHDGYHGPQRQIKFAARVYPGGKS